MGGAGACSPIAQTTDTQQALWLSLDWLSDPEAKEKCRVARGKLLVDKIEATNYIVNTIEQAAKKR